MTATFVFLMTNGRILVASNPEMVAFALDIATRKPPPAWQEIAAWLKARTIPTDASDEKLKEALNKLPGEWKGRVSARIRDYAMAFDHLSPGTLG